MYGVEACQEMATQVEKIIKHNKMEDKITVIRGMVEKCDIPEKADVLVSEWMGYMLIYISFPILFLLRSYNIHFSIIISLI